MESSEGKCVTVTMRRKDTGQAWGFRMAGGQDVGCSLHIAKVNPRSLSERCGLRTGDTVLRIGKLSAQNLNHDHAKAEILRAGNDLILLVRRGAIPVGEDPMAGRKSPTVLEEESEYEGDKNPTSQSRSFHLLNQFLQDELEAMANEPPKKSRPVNGPPQQQQSKTPESAPVRGSTYPSVLTPGSAAIKESMAASAAQSTEAAAKKPTHAAVVSSPASKPSAADTKIGAQAKNSNVAPSVVDAGAKNSKAAPAASTPKATDIQSTGSTNAAVVVASTDGDASVSLGLPANDDSAAANVSLDAPVVAEVVESVEAPLTIVAVDAEGDSAEYSDGAESEYTDGSVSEGSDDEAATFTITM